MAGAEENFDVPQRFKDEFDKTTEEVLINLSVRVVGKGPEFGPKPGKSADYMELGFTFDKKKGVNRVSFSTSRPEEFPAGFLDSIKENAVWIIMGMFFSSMDPDGQMPPELDQFKDNYKAP